MTQYSTSELKATRLIHRTVGLLAFAFAISQSASGQQFAVDDAEIVDRNACQLEAWHGQTESWILPACQFIPDLEIAAGMAFVDEGGNGRDVEYGLEGRYRLGAFGVNRLAIAIVAGMVFDPFAESGDRMHGVYAYVPVSVAVFNGRAYLHGNLGWAYHGEEHDHHPHAHDNGAHHAVTWGIRSDFWVVPGMALVAQVFGEDRRFPEVELGTRLTIVPDRVEADLSWGSNTEPGFTGAGWALGLTWTPPPFR